MKRKVVPLNKLFPLVAAALLFFAGIATAQTQRGQSAPPTEMSIQVGTATGKSPAVSLRAVGKEVSSGVFEVDPNAVRGKRLTLPRGEQTARFICIGKWKNGECRGIYIEW